MLEHYHLMLLCYQLLLYRTYVSMYPISKLYVNGKG